MTTGGWIMLTLMWGGIFALGIYCFSKVLEDNNNTDL